MKTDTQIIIERRARGSSKWDYYTASDANGQPFDEEGAISYAADREFHYRQFHFQAVEVISTRRVLQRP